MRNTFDEMTPAETFDLLGDETRLAILRTLAERQHEVPDDPALSFSALRERVGVRDSGRFNYHLERLVGTFVRRTAEGYELGHRGGQAFVVEDGPIDDETGTDVCPECGEPDCRRSFHAYVQSPWL